MINPAEIARTVGYARSGEMPPIGDLASATEVIGFSFGTYFDADGQLSRPGPVNDEIARCIVSNEVIRDTEMPMTLQEEVAWAVFAQDKTLRGQINVLPTIKTPGKAFNTHELIQQSRRGWATRKVGTLAIVAHPHHIPRASAQVRKAGFEVVTLDTRGIGFDENSAQEWTTSAEKWGKKEPLVIGLGAILGRL